MEILHALPRHARQLEMLRARSMRQDMEGFKYVCVVIDPPESVDRKASWASSFNDVDTHKLFQALAEQTKS
jgi:hypothetical protein